MEFRAGICRRCILATLVCAFGAQTANAHEKWDGSNLAIYGSTDPETTCEKLMENETLEATTIMLGTENGSARIVAKDSTLTAETHFYLGYEKSPGYPGSNLSSSLQLFNSTLSCQTFMCGYDVSGANDDGSMLFVEIGSGSVISCNCFDRYSGPRTKVRFTGGRMVFTGEMDYLGRVRAHTWTGAWPNRGVTFEGVDAPIDIEVDDSRNLVHGWENRDFKLTGNGGFVKRGTGELVWGWFTNKGNGSFKCFVDYTGDTVIKGGGIKLATPGEQVKYATAQGSALKIEEGAYFDFAGNSASFLGVSGAGELANTSETPARLTLGETGGDGVFSPATVSGALDLVKTGAGTLVVNASHIDGMLQVSNGVLRIAAGSSFRAREICVEPMATLDIRGANVSCGVFSAPGNALVLWDADTVFDCVVEVELDETVHSGRYGFAGSLRKTGAGTLTLLGECAKGSGTVSIEEGSVVCHPASVWPGKYFRLQYYGDAAKTSSDGVAFSEFSLYGTDGNRINMGKYAYTPLNAATSQQYGGFGGIDDASQLAECEVAVWMPDHNGFFNCYDSDAPDRIFDGKLSTYLRNTYYWKQSNILVFRVANGASDAVAFSFTTSKHPSRRPTQWKLEGSLDGISWTGLADNATNVADVAVWTWLTNSTPDTAETEYDRMVFDMLPAEKAASAPFGDAEVCVAKGALLDFVSADMTISGLKVDMDAPGGTITRFTPAEGGVIDIVTSSVFSGEAVVPLTVGQVASPENFKTWTVKVNGIGCDNLKIRSDGVVMRIGRFFGYRVILK